MLGNVFEPEQLLVDEMELLTPGRVFLYEDLHKVKLDLFKPLADADRAASVIQYSGFDIAGKQANVANQLIELFYRVIIVAPVGNKLAGGEKFATMLKALSGARLMPTYQPLELIKDVREFNAVDFGDSMIAIPALFSFKTALRK